MNIYVCFIANYNMLTIDHKAAEEIHLFSNWESVQNWLMEAIKRGFDKGFVLEEDTAEELEEIIDRPSEICLPMYCFSQANFGEHQDITITLKTLDQMN